MVASGFSTPGSLLSSVSKGAHTTWNGEAQQGRCWALGLAVCSLTSPQANSPSGTSGLLPHSAEVGALPSNPQLSSHHKCRELRKQKTWLRAAFSLQEVVLTRQLRGCWDRVATDLTLHWHRCGDKVELHCPGRKVIKQTPKAQSYFS